MMDYYGLSPAKEWIPPDTTIEGPIAHGLRNHFGTDCAGCDSHMKVVFGDDKLIGRSTEYIAVEFARGREFQTDWTGTTQETLATYLRCSGRLPKSEGVSFTLFWEPLVMEMLLY